MYLNDKQHNEVLYVTAFIEGKNIFYPLIFLTKPRYHRTVAGIPQFEKPFLRL
jgi:hypothetical protein